MKKISVLIFVFFVSFCAHVFGEIIKTHDFSDIKSRVETEANDETLIIFEIDEVLIAPTDQIFHQHHSDIFNKLKKDLINNFGIEEFKKLWYSVLKNRPVRLVDEQIKDLFYIIEKKGIKTIALTKCCLTAQSIDSEELSEISFEKWRLEQLENFNFNFEKLSCMRGFFEFSDIMNKYGVPSFRNGVGFVGGADKGIVLSKILEKFTINLKKIIFIDNKLKNLQSVGDYAKSKNIEFVGFYYAQNEKDDFIELNKERAFAQFKILGDQKVWIEDKNFP